MATNPAVFNSNRMALLQQMQMQMIFWKDRFLAACVMLIDGQVTCQAKIYNPLFALPLKKSHSEVKVYTSPVVEGRLSVHSFADIRILVGYSGNARCSTFLTVHSFAWVARLYDQGRPALVKRNRFQCARGEIAEDEPSPRDSNKWARNSAKNANKALPGTHITL